MDKSTDALILYSDCNEKIIARAIQQVFELVGIRSLLRSYDEIETPPRKVVRYKPAAGDEWLLKLKEAGQDGEEAICLFSFERYVFVMLNEQSAALALRILTLRGAIERLKNKHVIFVDTKKHLANTGHFDIACLFDDNNRLTDSIYSLANLLSFSKINNHFKAFMKDVSHENRRK